MTNKIDHIGGIKAGALLVLALFSFILINAGTHTPRIATAAGTTLYPYPTLALNLTPQTPVVPVNLSPSHSAAPLYAGDLAWNKPAFASTYWQNYYPARVTDGLTDPPEQWISASSTGTWFYVDLGTPSTIHQIVTTLFVDINFSTAPHNYYIVSNDLATWQIVADEINYNNAVSRPQRTFILPQDVTARYVGIYAADWSGGWGDMILFAVLPPTPNSADTIVFVRPQPGSGADSNIWIMNFDGSNQIQLTTYDGEDRWPALSPDGSRVAYVSIRNGQQQFWLMNSDGTEVAQLPAPGNTQRPEWSPDGDQIAFGNDSIDFWEVWVINADGTNPRRLTSQAGAAAEPSWSPNGQKLVYVAEPVARYYDLYTINSDGTGQTLLISASATGYSNHLPAWSHDGTEIAAVHWPAGGTGPYDLWLMNADGSNGRILVQGIDSPNGSGNNISWSKDGQWLIFGKNGQVWRVQRDGTQLTQITTYGGWEPSVGPGASVTNPCVADIMMVVDRSSSMDNNNKLNDAKMAVSSFITATNAPPDQIGLVSFGSTATLNQPVTTDKAAVIAATQALTTTGGTRIDLGLQRARLELASLDHDSAHRKIIILLSDGRQNPAGNDPVLAEANAAKAEGATLFTIGLGPDADAALLQQVATSPAYYYFAPTGTQLTQIYSQISTVLACSDIGGQVFVDQDNNGQYTFGTDVPLANATVNLAGPVISQTVSTNQPNENYLFPNIPPATYTVSLDLASLPAGYIPTTAITQVVNLTSAADDLDNHFGVRLNPDAPCLAEPLVYSNNFEGNVGPEWSSTTTDTTPTNRRFLGQFGNDTVSLVLTGLPSHTELTMCFDLFVIRSWDGNIAVHPVTGGAIGPDVWDLSLLSGPTLLHTSFTNWPDFRQAYPGTYPDDNYAAGTGARESDSLGYTYYSEPQDSVYRLQVTFPHSSTFTVLNFAASGLQPLADESWGIDNLQVQTNDSVQIHYTYLPLIAKPSPGIRGRVTLNGAPTPSVPLDLRFYNGASWSTRASLTTDSNGLFLFTNVPSLGPGQHYYVRYLNSSQTPGRLWFWGTRTLTAYTSGTFTDIGDFDIADITLVSPPDGATIWLPYTFYWMRRPATPTDSYALEVFDPVDGDPYAATDGLGYVSGVTVYGLPGGFSPGTPYGWDVVVESPDGGSGVALDTYQVVFSNVSTSGLSALETLWLEDLHWLDDTPEKHPLHK